MNLDWLSLYWKNAKDWESQYELRNPGRKNIETATVLFWLKNRPRYLLAILAMAAAAYAVDRWFFSGLIASKWIGLPQYASEMKELQIASRNWGIAALVLDGTALALTLPSWPKKKLIHARGSVLTLGTEQNDWTEYLGRCMARAVSLLLASGGLAILIPLIANFLGALFHR